MSITTAGGAAARLIHDWSTARSEPEGDIDISFAKDFGDAGDSPPIHIPAPPTYPGTMALLRPAALRDSNATINLQEVGLFAKASELTSAGPLASSGLGRFLRLLPRPVPTPPWSAPFKPDHLPSPGPLFPPMRIRPPPPPPEPKLPLPPIPGHTRPDPESQPERREPEPATSPDDDSHQDQNSPWTSAPEEETKTLASWFGKALASVLQRIDKRGTPATVRGTNIAIQECVKVVAEEFPELLPGLQHKGGGNQMGKFDGEYRKELPVETPTGWRRPDATFGHQEDGISIDVYMNTYTPRKDGTPTKREQEALDALAEEVEPEFVKGLRKLKPGDDEDNYRDTARDVCRKAFGEVRKKREKLRDERERKGKEARENGRREPENQ